MGWVVVHRKSLGAVCEVFEKEKLGELNTSDYQAVPVSLYLGSLNLKTLEEKREYMAVELPQNKENQK